MLGLPVLEPFAAADIVKTAMKERLFINAAGANTLRFVPPLILTAEEGRRGLALLRSATEEAFEAQLT